MNAVKLTLLLFLLVLFTSANLLAETIALNWTIEKSQGFEDRLIFEGAIFSPEKQLPVFVKKYHSKIIDEAYLQNQVFVALSDTELGLLDVSSLSDEIAITTSLNKFEGKITSYIEFIPFRINPVNAKPEKLISFDISLIEAVDHSSLNSYSGARKMGKAENSVLSTGEWYKLGIVESGVYLLNYNYLIGLNSMFAGADINSIKLYGNGGDMLPERNDAPRKDDLYENPMQAFDQNGNGLFDQGDYFLFYGDATDKWTLADGEFKREINIYADTSYYFISSQGSNANRMAIRNSSLGTAQAVLDNFDYRVQHQSDLINLEKSGREWYGELFDFTLSQSFNFTIPNLIKTEDICLEINTVARHTPSTTSSVFRYDINGSPIGNDAIISGVNTGYGQKFNSNTQRTCLSPQSISMSDNFNVNIKYDKNGSVNAKGYLNYITIEAKRALEWNGTSIHFRNKLTEQGGTFQFRINNAPNDLEIWDLTDPLNPIRQAYNKNGNQVNFKFDASQGVLNEFIAFSLSGIGNPVSVKAVKNQNLHAHQPKELIIITHPIFLSEAERFANYKRDVMGLSVQVVRTDHIYNEFSSGKQDLCALRDYMKMLFDRDPNSLENVLLFGDASYDYKYRSPVNTNFVPVYESDISLHDVNSHSSDDYIAFLEDGLGEWCYNISCQRTHKMSVGVGRFPVKTLEEAKIVIDKVIFYENKANVFGDWLNKLTFVADDDDSNRHMLDAEAASIAATNANPAMDIQKIYVDAYPEISSPSGALTIEGKNALDRAIQDGTLLINYSGHGGEVGWTEEQILRLDQISQWNNYDKLTFFFTATCEFGRYDDPDFVAGGELVLLERSGGAIGIMTTTRPVYSSANLSINLTFFNNVFDRENGQALSLGEIIRRSKNESEQVNNRNFALLGDPSMKLNYPDKRVLITEINQVSPDLEQDTLKALCLVGIKGIVADLDSSILTNFNGFVDLKVFDKKLQLTTLGNDNSKFPYSIYKNLLFKGKATVKNGEFNVNFVVPKDIDYSIGQGKIGSYAYDPETGLDANGLETRVFVGSSCDNIIADNDPPLINLYLDDTTFSSGDLTSASPELIAFLEDENGINFTGTGIGHDITALVSASSEEKIILNDYYLSELDNYQKGRVNYQLKDLPDGEHSLTLKAWDTHNNSSEATVQFVVASSETMALKNVMNYPNPFSEVTYFSFDHNTAGEDLILELRILDRTGKLMKTANMEIPASTTKVDGLNYEQLRWDGTNSQQQKLNSGVYFYEIKVKSKNLGTETGEIKRLVYIK
ncbi:MAG: type IX secretion system sortase PorU [Cytophagales bacterium]